MPEKSGPTGKSLWAYAYQLTPAVPSNRLRRLEPLLDRGRTEAALRTRTWQGRLVVERQVTHILIVSDSPDQDGEINRALEAELRQMQAEFSLTAPMAVPGDDDASEEPSED